MRRFDDIVLGMGGMGSAAAYQLARRGRRVLGLERYDLLHEQGSSHGLTRIIRLAYHEDPSYVPLLQRAYELWHELEARAGEQLLVMTGSLEAGPEDGVIFTGAAEAARLHHLAHTILDGPQIASRFPGFAPLPAGTAGVWQPDGGFLLAERCILAHVNQALAHGAELRFREAVREWEQTGSGSGVVVTTERDRYEADRLVVCAGPWAGELLPELAHAAVPERQALVWIQPGEPDRFAVGKFPVFVLEEVGGLYYGFPVHDYPGVKLGFYHHFREPIDPNQADRETTDRDEAVLRAFARERLVAVDGPTIMVKACIFTNSPDEHFIIGPMPDAPQVIVAAGFSGHGFKFCSVVGEVLADLAMLGATSHHIELFAPARVL